MNTTQMFAYQQNFGALVMAASRSILQSSNDFVQASSTEETIAEYASDASQSTADQAADANTSTNMPQIMSFSLSRVPSEMPRAVGPKLVSSGLMQLKHGCNPILQDDGNNDKKKGHKKRSKNWNVLETSKLIRARGELDELFRSSGRKAALWEEIAQALKKDDVFRDGHQCKDKWEKLTAGYKEVREGAREKEDLPFYKQIHPILSCKQDRRESGLVDDFVELNKGIRAELGNGHVLPNYLQAGPCQSSIHESIMQNEGSISAKKRKRDSDTLSFSDISVVQELLETVLTTQQQLFKDLLNAVEKKQYMRERIRLEREEMWRAEERAQRYTFKHTMMILIQKLGERPIGAALVSAPTTTRPVVSPADVFGSSKKRSKNWKRIEVFQLIRIRKEMESKFAKSSRRAGLWEEAATRLASLSIKRDGKQCREKWDKLMAGYKDVIDGRRDKDESPYYKELSSYMEIAKDSKASAPADTFKEENLST